MNSKYFSLLLTAFTIALAILSGCGSKDTVKTTVPDNATNVRPEWVGQRPFSSGYYIGVGSSSKKAQPLDYQSIAKKNALNDLATEISVRVQGNTFLNTLEVNKNFSEEFISNINTSTDELIEDYEVAGTWENDNEYWVYYRLNKGLYQQQKALKKSKAQASAYDFYSKGKEAENNANIGAAIDLYLRGLFALKDYWNDTNEYQAEEGKIFLDNSIYSSLQRVSSGLTIVNTTPKITLAAENDYSSNSSYFIKYDDKPVSGITTAFNYPKNKYMKPRVQVTDNQGQVGMLISEVNTNDKELAVTVTIDLMPLQPLDLDQKITGALLRNLKTETKKIPIEFIAPTFVVQSSEKVYGNLGTSATLSSSVQAELIKKGLKLGAADRADYVIQISANSTEGGTSQGFVVAFLEMSITITNRAGDKVFQESINNIKGLQLNKDAASIEAYKKGKQRIEEQMISSILESIF